MDIIQEMEKINESVYSNNRIILEKSQENEIISRFLKSYKGSLMESITHETDLSDKPVFKNADTRNAELIKRLESDEDFLAKEKSLKDNEETIKRLTVDNEYLKKKFEIYKLTGYTNIK